MRSSVSSSVVVFLGLPFISVHGGDDDAATFDGILYLVDSLHNICWHCDFNDGGNDEDCWWHASEPCEAVSDDESNDNGAVTTPGYCAACDKGLGEDNLKLDQGCKDALTMQLENSWCNEHGVQIRDPSTCELVANNAALTLKCQGFTVPAEELCSYHDCVVDLMTQYTALGSAGCAVDVFDCDRADAEEFGLACSDGEVCAKDMDHACHLPCVSSVDCDSPDEFCWKEICWEPLAYGQWVAGRLEFDDRTLHVMETCNAGGFSALLEKDGILLSEGLSTEPGTGGGEGIAGGGGKAAIILGVTGMYIVAAAMVGYVHRRRHKQRLLEKPSSGAHSKESFRGRKGSWTQNPMIPK